MRKYRQRTIRKGRREGKEQKMRRRNVENVWKITHGTRMRRGGEGEGRGGRQEEEDKNKNINLKEERRKEGEDEQRQDG